MNPLSNSTQRKNPWLALGMSLLRPGLGQLYNEEPRKAIILLALPYVLVWLWFSFSLINLIAVKIPGLVLFSIIFIAVEIWNLSDAFLSGRKKLARIPAPPFSRSRVLIVIIVAEVIVSGFLYPKKYIRANYFEPFVMPTSTMAPTLIEGDRFYVDKRHFRDGVLPYRGELAVFRSVDQKTNYVKRVVGLPGDKIELKNGVLFVNGTEAKQTPTDDRRGMENIDAIDRKRVYTENILGKERIGMNLK